MDEKNDKHEKYKDMKKYYDFSIDIDNKLEYEESLTKEIDLIHKSCGKTFTLVLKDFFKNENNVTLDIMRTYLKNEKDEMCPFCMQEAKNTYFKQLMRDKFEDDFILESDYINAKEKVKIKHTICGSVFDIKASNILSVKTKPICPHCSKLLTRAERMRHWRVVQALNRFKFSVNVKEKFIFKKYQDELIDVYHEKCKRSYKTTIRNFYKINTGSLNYLIKYVDNVLDLNCPHCMQEAKNKYFGEVVKKKTNGKFELAGNYQVANSKVLVRHTICNKEMEVWASNVISSKKPFKCAHCVKILKNSERIKQNKFIKAKECFVFPFDIEEPHLFKKNQKKIVTIEHKSCGRKFEVEFGKFNEVNVGQVKYLEKYIENKLDIKCPYCLQEAKNKYFQDILNELSNGDFILKGNYKTTEEEVEVMHKSCGKTFKLRAEIIVCKKRLSCRECINEENEYQNKLQDERNIKFNEELRDRGLEDFDNLGNYINRTTETIFLHKTCGYKFSDTPEKFLRRVNKCPNCTGNNRTIFKNQDEKNNVFQKRLNIEAPGFELRGDYLRANEEITLYHKDCKKEFIVKFSQFKRAKYACPHCQTNKIKYSKDLTIKEKIKYFEKELGVGYRILTGFVTTLDDVEIKHLRCGRTFTTKLYQAIKRKEGSILCPHCEKENRKNKFIENLEDKFKDRYILVGEYINGDRKTLFKHKGCDKTFSITPNKILNKTVEDCPYCKDKNTSRADKFKSKLYKKHKSEYVLVGEYVKYDKKALFKHRECNSLFWDTPYNILKKDTPCKKCATKKRIIPIEEVKRRINVKNGDIYSLAGEYMGTEKDIPVMCNRCGHVFEITPVKLFRKKVCPNCKVKHENELT